jgi:hypothetical protein
MSMLRKHRQTTSDDGRAANSLLPTTHPALRSAANDVAPLAVRVAALRPAGRAARNMWLSTNGEARPTAADSFTARNVNHVHLPATPATPPRRTGEITGRKVGEPSGRERNGTAAKLRPAAVHEGPKSAAINLLSLIGSGVQLPTAHGGRVTAAVCVERAPSKGGTLAET